VLRCRKAQRGGSNTGRRTWGSDGSIRPNETVPFTRSREPVWLMLQGRAGLVLLVGRVLEIPTVGSTSATTLIGRSTHTATLAYESITRVRKKQCPFVIPPTHQTHAPLTGLGNSICPTQLFRRCSLAISTVSRTTYTSYSRTHITITNLWQ
jgi:hypothetical protein